MLVLQKKKKRKRDKGENDWDDQDSIAVDVVHQDIDDSFQSFGENLAASTCFKIQMVYPVQDDQVEKDLLFCLTPLQLKQLSFPELDSFFFAPPDVIIMHTGLIPMYETLFELIRTQAHFYSEVKGISLLVSEKFAKRNGDPGTNE